MKFFDRKSIIDTAGVHEWIEAAINAMHTLRSGNCIMPKRMHIDKNDDTYLLMPCITDEYWSTKLVSFCPGNTLVGKSAIKGIVVLANSKTGETLALFDGSAVTAMRTAAVSAVGIQNLAPPDCRSLGIVGTGVQGWYQVLFACSVRKFDKIWTYDQNELNLKQFICHANRELPETEIICANNSTEVVSNSEVIITATNSQEPVFDNHKELFTGKTFIGIGSYKPTCCEFPEQLFRQLDQVFIDTPDAKKESGDLLTPIRNNWISADHIYPISDLLAGEIDLSTNPTRLYKTVGSAVYDLFAAKMIYEKTR